MLDAMMADEEKDPPVPADLEGAAKRIHRDPVTEEHDHEALAEDANL
jgi:hypothetical protein